MENTLKFVKIRKVKSPTRGTEKSAGIDFYVPEDISENYFLEKGKISGYSYDYDLDENKNIKSFILMPLQSVLIPAGLKVKVPTGHALIMFNKSGVAAKKHLDTTSEVVDEDYSGEIHLGLVNVGINPIKISAGEKILQGILIPVNYASLEEVKDEETLYNNFNTARGECGFGSTGVN